MSETSRRGYSLSLGAVLLSMVVVGAFALSLIATGDPAFPVQVFGAASNSANDGRIVRIRPPSATAIQQGQFAQDQLLPMPAVVPPPAGAWTGDGSADPTYRAAAALGFQRELDEARAAAQRGDRSAALARYAGLAVKLPDLRSLLLERASVLATFGDHTGATTLLRQSFDRHQDAEVRLLAARNAWWSERPLTADTLVTLALRADPGNVEALRLRETIRTTTQPPLSIAREWALASGAARDQLTLARALVREGDYASALGPFRAATADAAVATDSLLLEAASAAAAADSMPALASFTERYLTRRPADVEARLRLARAYGWRGAYAEALRQFELAGSREPSVRFEVAQMLLWSGREAEARNELIAVLESNPRNGEALKLLGDVALWRGDWATALPLYTRAHAADPAIPGLPEAIASAAAAREQARVAAIAPRIPDAYVTRVEAHADNQRFQWVSTAVRRDLRRGPLTGSITARHEVYQAATAGATSRNPGVSLRADGGVDLWRRARVDLTAGADQYTDVTTFASYGASLTVYDVLGVQFVIDARHEPAHRRVGSLAALQARSWSNSVGLTASATRGGTSLWSQASAEEIGSIVGDSRRWAAALSVVHQLDPRLSVVAGVNALSYTEPAPVLRGWGPLYWAPEYYVEPTLGARYRLRLAEGLTATAGATGGYGVVRERAGAERFNRGTVPTGALSADLLYERGRWSTSMGLRAGGSLTGGYRAATLTLQAGYRLGR